MVLLPSPEKPPPLPDVVARRRRIPSATAAVLHGPTVVGWAPTSAPLIEDWDCEEERAMLGNVRYVEEGRR
jgi:hypothetical protein